MVNPIKQIRYTVESTIIIKHSLTITKFPKYGQNPLITYDLSAIGDRKEFYVFAIFRYALVPNILTLNIKSVDFNVSILTTFSEGYETVQKDTSGFQLWLSISDSIVSSTDHTVQFSDKWEYDKLTIHMKDLVIKSGDFIFENKKDRCEPLEHIKDIIEMYNITISNTENVTLTVHGCFNMSVENLTCSNITWKEQELFTFTGGVLNTKNVLIKNILTNNNMKYIKSKTKVLFLINKSVAYMQNILIKDSAEMSSITQKRFSVVIIVQISTVQILNMKMVRNSFRNFLQAKNSSLCFENMVLIENNFTASLCRVEKSNVKFYGIKFHRNKIGCVATINLKSKVFITNSSLTENEILKAYSISRSLMELNNTKFWGNKMKKLMFAKLQSHIYIDNVTFTKNHVSEAFFNISRESKLEMYKVEFLENELHLVFASSSIVQNSKPTGNIFSRTVYDIKKSSNIQLNHVAFTRNKLDRLLWIRSNSRAIIKNNTLIENDFTLTVYDILSSTIQLNQVAFTRNKLDGLLWIRSNSSAIIKGNTLIENDFSCEVVYQIEESSTIQLNQAAFIRNKLDKLFWIWSNSSAIIKNNTLIENDFSLIVYDIEESSTIQLNHVAFTRNELGDKLFWIRSNSRAIIQNNTLNENNVSHIVYDIKENSTIKINQVTFINNKLKSGLLSSESNSNAIIQNNTLTENRFSRNVYDIKDSSTIQLMNVAFIQNYLQENLLNMVSSCSAKLINNSVVGNNLVRMFFAQSSYLEIDRILIKKNTLFQLIRIVECNLSSESMNIQENVVTCTMIYVQNSVGRMAYTYIENSAPALTTTCANLENGDFSFEITNTEIRWSYQVPVSERPIIRLNGNVSLSNVKLLVTSLSRTDIIQYSTKDIPLSVNEVLTTFPNIYFISSLVINCTKANVEHFTSVGIFRCIPCARGTYTLHNESLNTSLSFHSKKFTNHENTNLTCLDCPVGANCKASITSRSNFYGFKTKEQKLNFLPCPRGFCCTGSQCDTINSCNKNRIGTLCGRCIESYVESFLSTDCISIHSCQNFTKFWLVYCIYALMLTTFLYYMKDVITLIKTTARKSIKIFNPSKKEKESDSKVDTMIDIAGAEEKSEKTSHFTVSGIFTLIISFYQVKQLMKVDVQYKNSSDFSFITFITDCLNLEMVAITYSSYCPMSNLDAVSKAFVKTYLLTATLLIACLINYFISAVFHFFRSSLGRLSSLKPSDRLGVCFIRLLMLSYKNMASASLLLLNCVEVADHHILFIKGDIECYQWWQIVIAVLFLTWILFFPLSLKVSFNMFMKDKISFAKFILCLIIPFAVVANYRLNRNLVSADFVKSRNTHKVKEILSEIFQESYRLKTDDPSGETVFYETWRLYQRVLLAIVATFWIDPLKRITLMTPIVFLIAISYHVIKPYKPEMYILHWIEVFSNLGIFVCLGHNMFRGFLYVYDIDEEDPVKFVWQGFAVFDVVFSPICVLIYFFVIAPIYNKVKCKLISFYIIIRRE